MLNLAPPQTDFAVREAQLKARLAKVSDEIAALTVEHGAVSLASLEGDAQAAQRQREVSDAIKTANERRAALVDALGALRREREAFVDTRKAERVLQRRVEAGEVLQLLRTAARRADKLAAQYANTCENIHELREKLASYSDVTGVTREQLCKPWSFTAATAAPSRFLVEKMDLRPVSHATFTEQTDALFPNTRNKDE